MRVARFVSTSGEPAFGLVELAEDQGQNPDTIAVVNGDPLAGPVNFTGERVHLADVRLVSPVLPRSKVVGIGNNYAGHVKEIGINGTTDPVIFLKPNTSVIGTGEAIIKPNECERLDYEGELAIVISKICRRVPVSRAADVIFGYTVANDVTARDLQISDIQLTRAKSFDTFCVLGPWISTHLGLEEVADLQITTRLNGEIKQDESTKELIVGTPELIAYVSNCMTLLPGDVIMTGTPAGIGPMKPGDEISITVSGIGTLTNPVIAEEA